MEIPETRYAKTTDGVHIAYQVVGEGSVDLVLVASGLGLGEIWRGQRSGHFLQRLASFSRLILLDSRGMGLSDHVLDREQQLTLESRMEDVRAVMDAVDSARATLLGLESAGFAVAAMFAATLPERTAGLIAYAAVARWRWAPDYPIGATQDEVDAEMASVESAWATEELAKQTVEELYPSARDDAEEIKDMAAFMRGLGGPGDFAIWSRVDANTDLRDLLPSIRVPTLVIHRREDRAVPIEHGRYLAAHIPGAEFAELPGDIHMWDVGDDLPSAVERFVGTIHQEHIDLDRFLATCCSPTSSTPPLSPRPRVTEAGQRWSSAITIWFEAISPGTEAPKWTRLATGSSPRSTARLERCGVPSRSSRAHAIWESRSGPVCTPVRDADDRRQDRRHRCDARIEGRRSGCSVRGAGLADGPRPRRRLRSWVRGRRGARTKGRPRPLAPLSGG